MLSKIDFTRNFNRTVIGKEGWPADLPRGSCSKVIFTDDSKTSERTAAGLYVQGLENGGFFHLSKHAELGTYGRWKMSSYVLRIFG